jgi:hypothetical protein
MMHSTAWSVVKAQHTIFGQAGHSSCPIMIPGVSSLGVPEVQWYLQILSDQLCTLSQLGEPDYAHLITTGNP